MLSSKFTIIELVTRARQIPEPPSHCLSLYPQARSSSFPSGILSGAILDFLGLAETEQGAPSPTSLQSKGPTPRARCEHAVVARTVDL